MSSINFTKLERLDVHCHAITPKYREFLIQTGHQNPDGMPAIPEWTPEQHISLMKETNITTSILSISTPGTSLQPFNPSLTKETSRSTNIELSEICATYPQHFRFFASLPLPFVPESIAEIDYALDTLGAVGFCVLSNANGVYMGDKALDPIFDKLNERKAILLMHPTSCKILSHAHSHSGAAASDSGFDTGMTVVNPLQQIPSGLLEYLFDETRAVVDLLLSETVTRCPDIKFIMSHVGCVLPLVLERVAVAMQTFFGAEVDSNEMKRLLRERFYFDLAGLPWPDMIHALLRIVGPERLVYGSDYCWTPPALVKTLIQKMDEGAEDIWTEDTIKEVYAGNAKKLFGL
ncbi:Decarboxylase yanB [Lachnellula arida]|uniref:6-methylsalicylate decarboxylase n=1 Tax=Lachnellula arida TaxID=1316785 RepID=A0A8T9B710_9HELO|nr:Decarboxylase yanB [Lachnellula arida]